MTEHYIYHDIAVCTDGAFLIGVVGPVRTGKSTFIKRFMETMVISRENYTDAEERVIRELQEALQLPDPQ